MRSNVAVYDFVAALLLSTLTLLVLLWMSEPISHLYVHILFLVIIFQSVFLMIFIKSPILKVYYVFSYLFYGCIPYLEHAKRIYSYWGLPSASPDLLAFINFLIILLNFTVLLGYRFGSKTSFREVQRFYLDKSFTYQLKTGLNNLVYKDSFIPLIVVSILSMVFILYVNNFNIFNLLYRETIYDRVSLDGPVSLIVNNFIRPIPAVILIFYIAYKPKNYKIKYLFFVPLCLISVFPTAVPRFYAAAIYIPILILLFKGLLIKNRLNYFLIASLFIIFPMLNNFRRMSSDEVISLSYDLNFLFQGHFDSYLSISQVIQSDFITYGRQLVGNLLFFIPRSMWADKPTGTGQTLIARLNYDFTNISANYYAEGYANFGYLGMFIFAIFLGVLTRNLDDMFIKKLKYALGSDIIIPFYLISIGFLFFILRGDLLSSISFFIGFIFTIKFCSFFFKKI